jgi:hypothetical protein
MVSAYIHRRTTTACKYRSAVTQDHCQILPPCVVPPITPCTETLSIVMYKITVVVPTALWVLPSALRRICVETRCDFRVRFRHHPLRYHRRRFLRWDRRIRLIIRPAQLHRLEVRLRLIIILITIRLRYIISIQRPIMFLTTVLIHSWGRRFNVFFFCWYWININFISYYHIYN